MDDFALEADGLLAGLEAELILEAGGLASIQCALRGADGRRRTAGDFVCERKGGPTTLVRAATRTTNDRAGWLGIGILPRLGGRVLPNRSKRRIIRLYGAVGRSRRLNQTAAATPKAKCEAIGHGVTVALNALTVPGAKPCRETSYRE